MEQKAAIRRTIAHGAGLYYAGGLRVYLAYESTSGHECEQLRVNGAIVLNTPRIFQ